MLFPFLVLIHLCVFPHLVQGSSCPPGYTFNEDFNKCYKFVASAKLLFFQAQFDCTKDGANLVAIDNGFENQWLYQNLSATKEQYWIGLTTLITQDSSFAWVDHSNSSFTNWMGPIPWDSAVIDMTNNGFWRTDSGMSYSKNYICSTLPSSHSIMTTIPVVSPTCPICPKVTVPTCPTTTPKSCPICPTTTACPKFTCPTAKSCPATTSCPKTTISTTKPCPSCPTTTACPKTSCPTCPTCSVCSKTTVAPKATCPPPTQPPKPALRCDNGWSLYAKTSSCYKFIQNHPSYSQAYTVCQQNSSFLASIHSDEENAFVAGLSNKSTINQDNYHVGAFIGLARVYGTPNPNQQWIWTDGTPVEYTNWGPDRPHNTDSIYNCAIIRLDNFGGKYSFWDNVHCDEMAMKGTICKKPAIGSPYCEGGWTLNPYGGYKPACYKFFQPGQTYPQAATTCRNNGGYLTSIHNIQENNFIAALSKMGDTTDWTQGVFIGLRQKSPNQWSWEDGSRFDYANWMAQRPQGWNGYDCAFMDPDDIAGCSTCTRKWDNTVCNYVMRGFVCKKDVSYLYHY